MQFDARDHKEFFDDLAENRYHIFGRRHARCAGFYPNEFPAYPELDMSDIHEDHIITIRAFFPTSGAEPPTIDSGYIDLEVEHVDQDAEIVFGNILTKLPPTFALSKGTTIEVSLDEVLSVRKP